MAVHTRNSLEFLGEENKESAILGITNAAASSYHTIAKSKSCLSFIQNIFSLKTCLPK